MSTLAVLIIARLAITYRETHQSEAASPYVKMQTSSALNPDANLSKGPEEAATSRNSSTTQESVCQSLRARFQNLTDVKKIEKTSVRFVNIHKKINQDIYRLRFFYKDSSENEIPSYLLYKEDQEGVDFMVENTPYKKGVQYLKIEKAEGETIYTEEGVNIGTEQDLFLHYENGELKDLQGNSPLPEEKDFIECHY